MPIAAIQQAHSHQRWRLRVTGQVQGVGFRPFVYRLAVAHGVHGWVRNDGSGVEIQIEGAYAALTDFCTRVRSEAPPLARIDEVAVLPLRVDVAASGFHIVATHNDGTGAGLTPDSSVCEACLAELFDPLNRRYRHPFIHCVHCGPRYSVMQRLPYDRANTSMAPFTMCAACAAEYGDPLQRRFHAQTNACAECGPHLTFCDPHGVAVVRRDEHVDPIAETMTRLRAGEIVAIKGLGGFHLVCDARNARAIARLRQRKQRDAKPLALMAANAASVAAYVEWDAHTTALVHSAERPIVLLAKRAGCDDALPGIAPDVPCLGVMLPYAPLHYLVFHEAAGRPDGMDWLREVQSLLLVVTSANRSGEPLVKDNDEAIAALTDMADGFVLHDRAIVARCDDSVVRADHGRSTWVRRARGYAPRALQLTSDGPSVLACGGAYKTTLCMTRGAQAVISPHIGDVDSRAARRHFSETAAHLLSTLAIAPTIVAHDAHPDLFTTHFAQRYASEHAIPALAVQHHHAHAAAVMAEHGIARPVIALTLDGVGLGGDGTWWGGELLWVEGARYERLGHLRTLPLPGGDRAAREPWRMAASALHALGRTDEIASRFAAQADVAVLVDMLRRGVQCPMTSSAGRWFDAAAALLGVHPVTHYEAQAAMTLEALAARHGPVPAWNGGFRIEVWDGKQVLDLLPLLARLADRPDRPYGASLFHATLVRALADWVRDAKQRTGCDEVVLAGGCFLNALLSRELATALANDGGTVYEARRLPPNDGAISLGQAWIARQHAMIGG